MRIVSLECIVCDNEVVLLPQNAWKSKSVIMGYRSLNNVLSNSLLRYHVLLPLNLTRLILSTQKWLLSNFLKGAIQSSKKHVHSLLGWEGGGRTKGNKFFQITACFAWSQGGQSRGWACLDVTACGHLAPASRYPLSERAWGPQLTPHSPCSSSRQKRSPFSLSLIQVWELFARQRGIGS